MERLEKSARSRGLWNLFLPAVSGLTNLDYAPVAEISGWSPVIAPEAINCQAPATRTSTGTPNSSSTRSRCRPPTCWPAKATASAIALARIRPGQIHHAMRAIGMAERALALMVDRAKHRTAFGTTLADQGVVRELIAQSRIEIDQVRLYVYKTAWLIDREGAKAAQSEIAGIKVAAPAVATRVIDRAIEVHGGAGVSDDTPLAYFYAWARVLRIVDGPDAVHRRSIAHHELRRERPFTG